MKGRYPLDALRQIRRDTVDGRVRDVAERAAETERARAAELAAQRRRERAEDRARELELSEQARLEAGAQRATDLQAEAEWKKAEAERLAALRADESVRAEAVSRASQRETEGRAALALAEAEAKAIEQHRERWSAERERVKELAEEEAVQDLLAARDRGRGGAG